MVQNGSFARVPEVLPQKYISNERFFLSFGWSRENILSTYNYQRMSIKRLYITRHAKSDWANPGLDDIDRPLNERGKKDVPSMAEKMKTLQYQVDHIISSNARRARETADLFHTHYPQATIKNEHQLYHADIDEIFQTCIELDKEADNVMLVCHNPGITYFANVICGANVDNVPTCGVLVIDVDSNDWASLDMSKFHLVNFIYPKM